MFYKFQQSFGTMSKNNKVTLETGRGRKRGHGEGKRGPPKDDKSYKIDINQYIVGGEGMEGVTAGEVVMDSQPTEDGATLGSPLSINLMSSRPNKNQNVDVVDDEIDVEFQDNDLKSFERSETPKQNTSNAQKIWQHTKTIDLKSDLYKDRWTKIDGKAAICNNCRKIIKTRSSLQYHLGVAQCGPQCKEDHEHEWINKEFDSLEDARNFIISEELDTKFAVRSSVESGLVAKGRTKPEVPNQQWSCNRNNRSSTWVPKRKNSKKLLHEKCPAKFVVRPREVADKNEMVKMGNGVRNIKAESLNVTTKWIVYGCLSHSHDIENTKLLKLSHRVRKNIALLLKLDIPMYRLRSQYLKTEHFGGATGKIPDCENSRLIQRRCYPQQPDLTCPELEICFRYMALQFIRCFNFIRREDPTMSHNPSTGQCNGKPTNADDIIVVFMEEEQRKMFRESNGAIIPWCVQDIYKNRPNEVNLLSIMVLDGQGEATPVIQAISANTFESTAKIMMNILKQLEPATTSSIHSLVANEALEDPFINALIEVLPQMTTLTTYPPRPSYVEPYEFVAQSSLKPYSGRLDELIYATFKMNEAMQQKRDRIKFGFYGNVKSSVQLDFEATHPAYPQDNSQGIRFNLFRLPSEDDPNVDMWEVSKYQGQSLLETYIVSTVPPSKMLCNQSGDNSKSCRVVCRQCIKEVHHMEKDEAATNLQIASRCGHSLSCTCDDFLPRHSCEHFHIVAMYKNKYKPNPTETVIIKSVSQNYEVHIVSGRMNSNPAVTEEGACCPPGRATNLGMSIKGEEKEIGKTKPRNSEISNIEASNAISNTVENLVAAFSGEIDDQREFKPKLKKCTVKLERTSDTGTKRTSQSEYDELRNTAISRLTKLLTSLKKAKKQSTKSKRICRNVIDFIDNDCTSTSGSKTEFKSPSRMATEESEDVQFSASVNDGFDEKYVQQEDMGEQHQSLIGNKHNQNEQIINADGMLARSRFQRIRSHESEDCKDHGDEYGAQTPTKCSHVHSNMSKAADAANREWNLDKILNDYLLKDKEPRWKYQIIGHNSPRYNLLRFVNLI